MSELSNLDVANEVTDQLYPLKGFGVDFLDIAEAFRDEVVITGAARLEEADMIVDATIEQND